MYRLIPRGERVNKTEKQTAAEISRELMKLKTVIKSALKDEKIEIRSGS